MYFGWYISPNSNLMKIEYNDNVKFHIRLFINDTDNQKIIFFKKSFLPDLKKKNERNASKTGYLYFDMNIKIMKEIIFVISF